MDYFRRKAKEKPSGTIRTEEPVEFQHVDHLLQILGDPGPFQIIQFILLGLPFISMSFDDFMVIFYSLAPTSVRCYGDPYDVMDSNSTLSNLSNRTRQCTGRIRRPLLAIVHRASSTPTQDVSGP